MSSFLAPPIETEHGRCYPIEGNLLPGVTTILHATRPSQTIEALASWSERIGVEQAQVIRDHAAQRGSAVHALAEQHLRGEPLDQELIALSLPWWESVRPFLDRVVDPQLIESTVFHRRYCYAGTLDLLCFLGGRLTLVDFKSAHAPRRHAWLGDYPLQLAAYAGAIRQTHGLRVERAAIALAHPEGPAQIFFFDRQQLRGHWRAWLLRLELFWKAQADHPLREAALAALVGGSPS